MSDRLRHGRLALVGISLAAVFAACSGSSSGTPSAAAQSLPAAQSSAASGAASSPASSPASSESAGQSSSEDASPACAIVSKDAVSQAMGFPVATVAGAGQICTFQTADSSHYMAVQLYESQADMALVLQIEPGGDHIAGLGDDAFYVSSGILFVRQGDHAIEILDPDLIGSATDTTARDAMVTLVRTALPKL